MEADELSNGITRQFNPQLEVSVDVTTLPFVVLPTLMKEAEAFYGELARKKKVTKSTADAADAELAKPRAILKPRKRKLREALRATDPW